ncbi:DUF4365 domain-containing protein [Kribbella sp. NPDC051620]|uniref:DUF4365 domain-containing protein n=1 Tax=Kribbella sp. NPDC051620 TaxID=3364120 RepID=UPI00378A53D7
MTELTNRRGVNTVEEQALEMDWFFRDQPISDQGIDAHVEKAPGGAGTGRLLALQIKSGPSYFSEPTKDGWIFRFAKKKARLWLEHALPVLVVLVDIQQRVAYWQHISEQTIQSTGKGFKVEVPQSNTVADADDLWTHIASGIERRAAERYDLAMSQLPPQTKTALRKLADDALIDARVLAVHLAEGRGNPRATVQSLLLTRPGWLSRNTPLSWQALGSYAAEHDHCDLSADAFERASEAVPDPGALLAAAALNVMPYDAVRSEELLIAAERADSGALLIAIGRSLLNHPAGDAGARTVPPSLLDDTEELRTTVAVQAFLSDQARRANELDVARRHALLALEADPESSDAMLRVAEITLRRVQAGQLPDHHLLEAIDLLNRAHQQRREWAGPTLETLVQLLMAHYLLGQFDDVLAHALPSPIGSATADEAADPEVRRFALVAASYAGRRDLVESLSSQLGEKVQDNVTRLRVGALDLGPTEERALLEQEFERAVHDDDYVGVLHASIALASHGVNMTEAIRPLVERSIIQASDMRLIEALADIQVNTDAALAQLRSLARTDMGAAEHLIGQLVAAERFVEAAEACLTLYESTRSSFFVVARAEILIQGGDDHAEEAARAAIAQTGFSYQRRSLLTFLAQQASDRGDWDEAEEHLSKVLTLSAQPRDSEVWNLLVCLVELGRLMRASEIWQQYRPSVRDYHQAILWLKVNGVARWDESLASEALTLARRFNEPALSTALLSRIITTTIARETKDGDTDPSLEARRRIAQGSVPADLHRQAFIALNGLVEEFGSATGVTVLRGEPEDLIEQITEQTRTLATAEPLLNLVEAAKESRAPVGILTSVRRSGYATFLIQRLLPLVAGAADDAEHEDEVANARGAIDGVVVIETAALLTLTADGSLSHLDGHFRALQYPTPSLYDVHRAVFDIRGLAGSPGSTTWDYDRDAMTFSELGDDEFIRQMRRSTRLEQLAEGLAIRPVRELPLFERLADEPSHSAWLAPIQLAHDQQLPLWSDDLGLRRLARHFGVLAFGTPALVDALRDRGLQSARTPESYDSVLAITATTNQDLAADLVVDVVLHIEDLIALGDQTGWLPEAGALVLARPSWWAWQPAPFDDLLKLYAHIKERRPERLSDWQHAAMIGAAKAYQQAGLSTRVLAAIALLGFEGGRHLDDLVAGCLRARHVAKQLNLPDPVSQLPAAAAALSKGGRLDDPATIVERVLARLPVPSERNE